MTSAALRFAAVILAGCALLTASATASTNLDLARQLNQAFVEVAEKVSPAVVVITVTQKAGAMSLDDLDANPEEFSPREFWRRFHRQFEKDAPPPEKEVGQGSGVVIREDGYILTNRHVVDEAETIEVRLKDGRSFKAKVRGVDPQSDVAVIQIEAHGLPFARLADSTKTRVGEFAIAIGAPFNLDYSVTFGHVSAKGRGHVVPVYAGGAMLDQDFIQTDANINPGNSGGPLVNIDGEVIGINTLISGLRTGIGFAIPSSLAREVADKLIADGKFTRAWLGVEIRALRDDTEMRELVKGIEDGVIVRAIQPDGPAAHSELRASDVITAVDGKRVVTAQELRNEIRGKKIGQPVTLDVFRANKVVKIKIKPGEWVDRPTPAVAKHDAPKENQPTSLGMTVELLTPEIASGPGIEARTGLVVSSVERNGLAARKGIRPGDVITAVNHQEVATLKQFRDALKKADLKKGVIVNLQSGDTARFEILKEGDE